MEWKYVWRNLLSWKVFSVEQFLHSEWTHVIVIKMIQVSVDFFRKKLKKKSFLFCFFLCHVDSIYINIVYLFITKKMHNNETESFSFAYFRWYRKFYVQTIFLYYSKFLSTVDVLYMHLKLLLKLKSDRLVSISELLLRIIRMLQGIMIMTFVCCYA